MASTREGEGVAQAKDSDGIPVVAHRGCVEIAPENTLEAFQKAVDRGADAIELDVRATSDGEYVVIHDETVDRTTAGSGVVNQMTVGEIKELEIENGYRIPTLTEALAFFSEHSVDPWIEIKESGIAYGVQESIRGFDLAGTPVMFASHGFIDEVLDAANQADIMAGISVGPTIAGRYPYPDLEPIALVDTQGFTSILVTPENLSERLVCQCLERSIQLGLVIDL